MTDPIVNAWSPYPPSQSSRQDVRRPALSQINTASTISSTDGAGLPIASTSRRPTMPHRETSSSYKSDSVIDNFKSSLDMVVPAPVGAMSISPAARDVVLASRKGLFIIDLNNPSRLPRFLPQGGLRSVADVQWAPHSCRPRSVVSTSAQKLLLWDLGLPSHKGISREVEAHTRAIADINWAVFNSDVVATAGIDGWIKCWDLRTSMDKDAGRFSAWGWGSGATQVKWNRKDEHIVASSHDNKVLIWDKRMGSIPVTRIRAHDAKIYGIDWSRSNGLEIVTCSLDKTIKLWNINSEPLPISTTMLPTNSTVPAPSASALDSTQAKTLSVPLRTIHTTAPVWRARFLPFGAGILSLPQAVETTLDMWAIDSSAPDAASPPAAPPGGEIGADGSERVIKTFVGHSAKVKEFVWRTRGGDDLGRDDRTFQLITWGTDQTLRFWPIEEKTMIAAGHKPNAPIKVIMTRRGAKNQSCIEEPAVAPVLSSSPGALDGSASGFAFEQGYARRRPTEAVVSAPLPHVIAGVRPLRHPFESGSSSDGSSTMGSGVTRHLAQTLKPRGSLGPRKKKKQQKRQVQAVVMTRGTTGISMVTKTDASTAAQNWNENVNYHQPLKSEPSSRAGSPAGAMSASRSSAGRRRGANRSSSRMTATSDGRSTSRAKNGDESTLMRMAEEGKMISTMEKTYGFKMKSFPVTTGVLDVEVNGPWGVPDSFTRSPSTTPVHLVIKFPEGYPKVQATLSTVEIVGESTSAIRKTLRTDVDALVSEPGNCMEKVLKFLLGVDRENPADLRRGRMMHDRAMDSSESESDDDAPEVANTVLTKQLLQRPCGATFGPHGELICFFSQAVSSHRSGSRRASGTSALPSGSVARWSSVSSSNADRPLSNLDEAMSRLTSAIKTDDGKRAAPKISHDLPNHPALRMRPRSRTREVVAASAPVRLAAALQIFNVSDITLSSKILGERYVLRGKDPIKVCRKNASAAKDLGRIDHESVWKTLGALFGVAPAPAVGVKAFVPPRDRSKGVVWGEHPSGRKQVDALLAYFVSIGDVQMVATMLNVLFSCFPPRSTPRPPMVRVSPGSDYFTQIILPANHPRRSKAQPPTPNTPYAAHFPSRAHLRDSSPSSPQQSPRPTAALTQSSSSYWKGPSWPTFSLSGISGTSLGSSDAGSSAVQSGMARRAASPGGVNWGSEAGGGGGESRTPRDSSPAGGSRKPSLAFVNVPEGKEPAPKKARGIKVQWFGDATASKGASVAGASMHESLISPEWLALARLSQYIYADLLFRWDLVHQRARLLQSDFSNLTTTPIPPGTRSDLSLELMSPAPTSHISRRSLGPKSLSNPSTPKPHQDQVLCSICSLTVSVAASTCLRCLHTSHHTCFRAFFTPSSAQETARPFPRTCATGCGCLCAILPDDLVRFPLAPVAVPAGLAERVGGGGMGGSKWRSEHVVRRSFNQFYA